MVRQDGPAEFRGQKGIIVNREGRMRYVVRLDGRSVPVEILSLWLERVEVPSVLESSTLPNGNQLV